MKKIFTLLFAMGLFSFSSYAQVQNLGKVNGTINTSQKAIDAATVSLLSAKDSTIIKIAISDKNGAFEVEKLLNGKYLVSVQSVGYAKYYSETFELATNKNYYTVKAINLKAIDKQLGDVTVTSKKLLIEQKLDRMIVNVDASVTNVGDRKSVV